MVAFVSGSPLGVRHGSSVTSASARRPSSSTRPVVRMMAFSSIQNILTDAPLDVSTATADAVTAVYKHVLGNAHLMESERAELADAESTFFETGNVKEFVRAIGKSDAYLSRFFSGASQYRFFELAYKHFLGRGPRSQAEIGALNAVYASSGAAAVVDHLLDSGEYDDEFEINIVPFCRFKGEYPTNEEFNRMCALRGGWAMSDKGAAGAAKVGGAVASGTSPSWLTIAKGLPPGTEQGTGFVVGSHWASAGTRNRDGAARVGTKIPGGVVFY